MANPQEPPEEGTSRRLSDDDVARLSEQIASLTSAGLALAPGLRAAAEEMNRGRLRSTLYSLADAIDHGATVDEALASQGSRLPAHLRGLIAVGSRTGKIGLVLGRFLIFANVGAELRRRLAISLAYPLLALSIAAVILSFICSVIVPSFENIFRDFGVPLPGLTIVLIEIAHLFAMTWRAAVEVLIGLFILWLLFRLLLGRESRRTLLGGLPLIGFIWRQTSLAEFCHLLALLVESEVPLPEAIKLTGEGVQDAAIHRACSNMSHDVEGGMSLAEAVVVRPIFPKGLYRIIRWAEPAQTLPESLHMAGEMYEAGAKVHTGLAGTVFAVVTITAIIACIGLVTIGLFLPLITLITKLSG